MYENYQKYRNEKGISNYQVSKDTGVSQATLSNWKNQKTVPNIANLLKIANDLDCTVDDLVRKENV